MPPVSSIGRPVMRLSLRLVAAAALLLASLVPLDAATLGEPAEKPILTISGNIGVTNKDGTAQFDRSMLEAVGMVAIETTTPWYAGAQKFEGVPLAKLMELVGARGDKVVA